MIYVPLDRVLDSPFQPRRHYDDAAIAELADSIERDGQLQTPVARLSEIPADHVVTTDRLDGRSFAVLRGTSGVQKPLDRQRFVDQVLEKHEGIRVQLAYGHRRARAWRLVWERHQARAGDLVAGAGLPGLDGVPPGTMPVELQPLTDEQMFARGVTENRQREDVSAVEEAEAMHRATAAFGWTHDQVGRRFGYTRATVSNKLRLLKLPADVRQLNVEGLLPERTARALVRMYDLGDELAPFADAARFELHQWAGAEVRGMLEDGATHEQTVSRVDEYVREVERAATQARREREPEMFADEPFTEPAGADAAEAPAFTPEPEADTPEPLAVAEDAGAEHVAAEVERIRAEYVSADSWRDANKPGRRPHDVELATLEATVVTLRRLDREASALGERAAGLDFPTRDRVSQLEHRVAGELESYEGHLARRRAEHQDEADGYDDGGAQLAAVAEAQGLQPFDEVDDGEEDLAAVEAELADREPEAAELYFWPPPQLPDVWDSIDGMTVAQLDEAYRQYALPLFTRYEGYYQTGQLKPAKQGLVRRVVRHHADLAAVQRLTEDHMAEFAVWFDGLFKGGSTFDTLSGTSRGHRSARHEVYQKHGKEWASNVKTAGAIADTADMVARLSLMTEGEEASVKREIYRLAASFCYSLFLEQRTADVSADTTEGDGSKSQPARTWFAAVGPDEKGRTIILGLGSHAKSARDEVAKFDDGTWETEGVYPCQRDLAERVASHGGHDIVVHVREDGVVDLAPLAEPDRQPGGQVQTAEPPGQAGGYPKGFPMLRRLRAAKLTSLAALRADLQVKGGPEAWAAFAIEWLEGIGRTGAQRIVDAYSEIEPFEPVDVLTGNPREVACPTCCALYDEPCKRPGGGPFDSFHHSWRERLATEALSMHGAGGDGQATETAPEVAEA